MDEIQTVILEFDISYADGHWTKGRKIVSTLDDLDTILNIVLSCVKLDSPITQIEFTQWIDPVTNPHAHRIKWLQEAGNIIKFQQNPENKLKEGMIYIV